MPPVRSVRVHIPKYCYHKARGLAYVRNCGRVCFRYLGRHGSTESKEAYRGNRKT